MLTGEAEAEALLPLLFDITFSSYHQMVVHQLIYLATAKKLLYSGERKGMSMGGIF